MASFELFGSAGEILLRRMRKGIKSYYGDFFPKGKFRRGYVAMVKKLGLKKAIVATLYVLRWRWGDS